MLDENSLKIYLGNPDNVESLGFMNRSSRTSSFPTEAYLLSVSEDLVMSTRRLLLWKQHIESQCRAF